MKRLLAGLCCAGSLFASACIMAPAVYSAVGPCPADCKTNSCLIATNNDCQLFEDPVTHLETWNAFNGITTYAPVITETLPANLTGNTINVWGDPCNWQCVDSSGNPQNPQACPDSLIKRYWLGSTRQRKCTPKSP